jgi:hypothetical protein
MEMTPDQWVNGGTEDAPRARAEDPMTMRLTLEDQDRELLTRVLTRYLGDLKMEIGDTDSRTMRAELHRDEDAIKSILERLSSKSSAGTAGA